MRIVRWIADDLPEPCFGLWIDDMIADAGTAEDLGLPPGAGAEALFARGASALMDLEGRAVTRTRRPRSEVRLLAPIVRPSKILAVGLNYSGHAEEQGLAPPEEPMLFLKPPSSIIGPEEDIIIPPFVTHPDPEVELAFVIGRRAKGVRKESALRFVAGYTVLNDFSARKLQKRDGQYGRAKGIDTFTPVGPCVVTKDELRDPQNLSIQLSVDGEVRQQDHTANMIHPVAELVAFITAGITLEPGDVIATGTPAGVGVHRDPRVFIESGQLIRCEIEGIGALTNRAVRQENGEDR
jgi:acylpyruvate hydrolase